MGDTSLQDRLRDHAKAFDGLLSLIPAKMYYGDDTNSQDNWRQKKQSKDEAKAARRGKLDPDSDLNRNAKEVMDERARNKRKHQEIQDQEDNDWEDEDTAGLEREKPGEGLKINFEDDESNAKKPRLSGANAVESRAVKEKRKAKIDKKRAKKEDRKETRKQLKAEKEEKASHAKASAAEQKAKQLPSKDSTTSKQDDIKPSTEGDDSNADPSNDLEPIDVSGLVATEDSSSDSDPASDAGSPIFDGPGKNDSAESASTETSISSTLGPSEKPKYIKVPSDTTALRARLAARIEALRAARKADGPDGKPIRTRQELIESRREKQVQRKEHKKELRKLAKEEEDKKREEALASARNSPGSILSPMVDLDDERSANHFAFGRVAFNDGTEMSHDLSYEKTRPGAKKKGTTDAKAQLVKLQAQKTRLANMDEDKRKEVLEKETWLAARRRAEGEKVRDDEAMLKKSIKRKDKAKKKSEREWSDRTTGVDKSIKDRQKKREDNLRKRREDKHTKGKKKGGASKKKNRPGFEGGFGSKRK